VDVDEVPAKPYRGAAPAMQDLIAGHVQVMFDSVMLQRPLVGDGKTRALAVLTPNRIDSLPDVATMTEAGFGQMQSGTWFGMFAPAGTPREAIAWVNRETRNAFAAEQVRQRYLSQGTLLPLGSPDDFAAHIATERQRATDSPGEHPAGVMAGLIARSPHGAQRNAGRPQENPDFANAPSATVGSVAAIPISASYRRHASPHRRLFRGGCA
jgi:hypothetical protein